MTEPHAERVIDLSVEVPGTPEEVWEDIATGPGITSWFIPIGVEEREGGEVTFDWGDYGRQSGTVAVWDPPRRVVFEGPEEGGSALAYEWLIEARDGGTCIVRLVNSGFGEGEQWDEQYHGMRLGWQLFLENLRILRTRFPGRRAHARIPTVMVPGPQDAAWASFCSLLGISPSLHPGDALSTSGDGVPVLRGVVESVLVQPAIHAYLLALEAPSTGTAFVTTEGQGEQVMASVYLYLHDDLDDGWREFLRARHPAPEGMPTA
jgi:uncharacterized protein YndB with AHSA1/START domain